MEAVANYWWQRPSETELAATGHRPEDFPEPEVEVWDENWDVLHWFFGILTQRIISPSGYTVGINYLVAYRDWDDMGIVGTKRDEWKWKLRIMEAEALANINKPAS